MSYSQKGEDYNVQKPIADGGEVFGMKFYHQDDYSEERSDEGVICGAERAVRGESHDGVGDECELRKMAVGQFFNRALPRLFDGHENGAMNYNKAAITVCGGSFKFTEVFMIKLALRVYIAKLPHEMIDPV